MRVRLRGSSGRRARSSAIVGVTAGVAKLNFRGLNVVHGGLVGDYVLWIAIGLATFSIAFALH